MEAEQIKEFDAKLIKYFILRPLASGTLLCMLVQRPVEMEFTVERQTEIPDGRKLKARGESGEFNRSHR